MRRTDLNQPNLIDGTIYAYQVDPDGVYVTIKGDSDTPLIASFDMEDVDTLRNIVAHFAIRSDFAFYAEPADIDGLVCVGVGSTSDGERLVLVVPRSGAELTTDQVEQLISVLTDCLDALREVSEP